MDLVHGGRRRARSCPGRDRQAAQGNDRFRDLIDLTLLRGLLDEAHLPQVRAACVEIFRLRDKHAWPPTLIVPDSWRDPYPSLAEEVGFEITDVDEAAGRVRALIEELNRARGD